MTIHEFKHGAVTIISPDGPLVQTDADRFKERAIAVFSGSLGRVVVDVSKVPFVDSKGLEALLDVNDHLGQSGQAIKLCAANKTVREVLSLTELAPLFEQYDDVTAAVRSFL